MSMHFDWRDLFKAPRMAIASGKKMVILSLGLLLGYSGYMVFTYLALLFSGYTLPGIWSDFGFFPITNMSLNGWFAALLWLLGIVFFLSVWMLFSTAVSKITYEELKGDQFYSSREALRFVKRRYSSILYSPLTLFALIFLLVIAGALLGLIGRIPALGEVVFALFYGVPSLAVSIFGVLVIFVFLCSFILTPAIVACQKSDTFTTVVEYFQTIWNQPGRFFGYGLINLALAKVGMFVFGYFVLRALEFVNWASGLTMGAKLERIFSAAVGYLPLDPLWHISNLYPGSGWAYEFPGGVSAAGLPPTEALAAFTMGLTLIFLLFLIWGYGLSAFACGQTISYLVTYKHREEENLLERKPEEEGSSHVEAEAKMEEKLEPKTKK